MTTRGALLCACVAFAAAGCGETPIGAPSFRMVGGSAGFRFRHELPSGTLDNLPKAAMGGFALIDYDSDGDLDLYFVNGGWHDTLGGARRPEKPARNRLLRNLGNMQFEDVTNGSGADDAGFGLGACVGDIDNDGHPDLFVSNYGGSALLRNRGDGTFEDITEAAGIAPGSHAGAVFADVDRDGLVDLFVTQYVNVDQMANGLPGHTAAFDGIPPPAAYRGQPAFLYRNRGDLTFADVSVAAGVSALGKGMGVVATDIDGDAWIDLVVANDSMENFVWRNKGDGTFEDIAMGLGIAFGLDARGRASMGVDAADVSGDGRLDVLMPDTTGGALYVAQKEWFVDRASDAGWVGTVGILTGWTDVPIDVECDGDIDVFKVHGDFRSLVAQESFLMLSDDEGWQRDIGGPELIGCGRGGIAADLDDDGLQDLVVLFLEDDAVLLENTTVDPGNWVRFRLRGTTSNRMALGARVTGTVDGKPMVREIHGATGYLSAGDPRPHFGLGRADEIEDVVVTWPNGDIELLGTLDANREYRVVEGQGVVD